MITAPSHPSGSALRERMIEDMTVSGFTEGTRRDSIRCVRRFAAFIGRSPDTATAEDLRRFQVHQTQAGMQPPCDHLGATRGHQHPDRRDHDRHKPCLRLAALPLQGPAGGAHHDGHHDGMDGDVAQADQATRQKLSQHGSPSWRGGGD